MQIQHFDVLHRLPACMFFASPLIAHSKKYLSLPPIDQPLFTGGTIDDKEQVDAPHRRPSHSICSRWS